MDKTIALVVVATVLLLTSLAVISIGTNFLNSLDDDADSMKDQRCSFQIQQYCDGDADLSEVDNSCYETTPSCS